MILGRVKCVAGGFLRFREPPTRADFSHIALLVVSGCLSGLLSNYCRMAPSLW
jgi:hypothetical protein